MLLVVQLEPSPSHYPVTQGGGYGYLSIDPSVGWSAAGSLPPPPRFFPPRPPSGLPSSISLAGPRECNNPISLLSHPGAMVRSISNGSQKQVRLVGTGQDRHLWTSRVSPSIVSVSPYLSFFFSILSACGSASALFPPIPLPLHNPSCNIDRGVWPTRYVPQPMSPCLLAYVHPSTHIDSAIFPIHTGIAKKTPTRHPRHLRCEFFFCAVK